MDLKVSLAGCFLGELGCSNTITHTHVTELVKGLSLSNEQNTRDVLE